MNNQVFVTFLFIKYYYEVFCDDLSIQASNLLFWQYNRIVMHDRMTNKYSFEMNEKPITIVFLTPK